MFKNNKTFFLIIIGFLAILAIMAIYGWIRPNLLPIRSDGLGYYLYLPAAFIHQDLSLQKIATHQFHGRIPVSSGAMKFRNTQNYLIKYPMGIALLMAPFFMMACLFSFVLNLPLDGFSPPFQLAACISGLFYTLAGLAILWHILRDYFKENTVLIVLCGLVFGTNIFHYATFDSVMSHSYSFFLFAALIYFTKRIYSTALTEDFIVTGLIAGLIVLTRPQVWLLWPLLYGIYSKETLIQRLYFWKKHYKKCLLFTVSALAIASLQFAYWKIITGSYTVPPYGQWFFDKPEIFNVLFSARKGLFFWAPVLLLAIPGIFYVRKNLKEFFWPVIFFSALNIYIISSWHAWSFGGSFGHRAFVDAMPMFAICLCAFYEGLQSIFWRRTVTTVIILSALYTTWLMLKFWTGVIPFDECTLDHFINTFFQLTKK